MTNRDVSEILNALPPEQEFKLFGVTAEALIELRCLYRIFGGNDPITPDAVRAVTLRMTQIAARLESINKLQ